MKAAADALLSQSGGLQGISRKSCLFVRVLTGFFGVSLPNMSLYKSTKATYFYISIIFYLYIDMI